MENSNKNQISDTDLLEYKRLIDEAKRLIEEGQEIMKEDTIVIKAFIDIMDGTKKHDLQSMTGLSEHRCDEIYAIYQKYLRE